MRLVDRARGERIVNRISPNAASQQVSSVGNLDYNPSIVSF